MKSNFIPLGKELCESCPHSAQIYSPITDQTTYVCNSKTDTCDNPAFYHFGEPDGEYINVNSLDNPTKPQPVITITLGVCEICGEESMMPNHMLPVCDKCKRAIRKLRNLIEENEE